MASGEDRAPGPDWERLVELLGPIHARAAGVARRLAGSATDGDDLFQEAVLRALHALPSPRDPSRFASWFYAILLSLHRNRTRRSFWRRFLPLEPERAPVSEPVGGDGSAWEAEREQAARLSRALSRLPAPQREAVVLFEIEGFGIDEIAALQRVSSAAVKSRLARGRARLRRIYAAWGMGRGDRGPHGAERTGPQAGLEPPVLASIPEERSAMGRGVMKEGNRHG